MPNKQHRYETDLTWTGDNGVGTMSYVSYGRSYELSTEGKPSIPGSADAAFRGDRDRWNPEELRVASLSACHQLWYLHLCAEAGIVVLAYQDRAEGIMEEQSDGAGQFTRIVLRPKVTIAPGCDPTRALALHADASRMCFIKRTLNCEVTHEPSIGFDEKAQS